MPLLEVDKVTFGNALRTLELPWISLYVVLQILPTMGGWTPMGERFLQRASAEGWVDPG